MLKKSQKYRVKLNGGNHVLEVSDSGKYVTIYGSIFPEKTILIPHSLDVSNGDIISLRTTSVGIAKLHIHHEETFKPGNAYSFGISGIQEVRNEEG